jgi:hypothetical protein
LPQAVHQNCIVGHLHHLGAPFIPLTLTQQLRPCRLHFFKGSILADPKLRVGIGLAHTSRPIAVFLAYCTAGKDYKFKKRKIL